MDNERSRGCIGHRASSSAVKFRFTLGIIAEHNVKQNP